MSRSIVRLDDRARLLWDEALVLGRSGEAAGGAEVRVDVVGPAGVLCRQGWRVGPGAPGWDGAGGLGGRRVLVSRLRVDPASRASAVRSVTDGRVSGGVWSHDGWSLAVLAGDEVGRLREQVEELG